MKFTKDAQGGVVEKSVETNGYTYLRVEQGEADYARGIVQPVAVFTVNDRRGEVRFDAETLKTRIANKEARLEWSRRSQQPDDPGDDAAVERWALAEIEAFEPVTSPAP